MQRRANAGKDKDEKKRGMGTSNLPSMPKIGNIAFAGGTVAIAMVAGFFMQAGSFDRAEPKQVAGAAFS